MAIRVINSLMVDRNNQIMFLEGYCDEGDVANLPKTKVATGSNFIVDNGDWMFYSETAGDYSKMLSIKQE